MSIKDFIIRHKRAFSIIFAVKREIRELSLMNSSIRAISEGVNSNKRIVYYCGVPVHGNLGDLAQGVCIRRWLKKHYSDYHVTEIETNALVNTKHSCLKELYKAFKPNKDFIVFQSGYTTTDLGGYADPMHQAVINTLPNARILMMPQTIFFRSNERRQLCSQVYDGHKKMLFLARDITSFKMAEEMFPNLPKKCFPDIVTTLIGSVESNQNRDGIMFCLRDDGEKYYSDEDLMALIEKCKALGPVNRTDTTKGKSVVQEAEHYIYSEINEYAKYKVMVTDRYHGTILSLVAGTPVIILKTTDHKVTTGADWFKGVYDEYVFLANDLDDAFKLAEKLYSRDKYVTLESFFEANYYDKLPTLFEELVK